MLADRFPSVLERVRAGDEAAFAELWRATQPMLLRYLTVRAGDLAEDVAAQAWAAVVTGLSGFEGGENQFRRWIVTIARNNHVDLVRRAARRPELLVENVVEAAEPTGAADPADLAETQWSTGTALALVRRLPVDQAEMVTLRVLVGLDVAEVAALVGRSPGAVRVAVHRGLGRLRELLMSERDARAEGAVTDGTAETFSD